MPSCSINVSPKRGGKKRVTGPPPQPSLPAVRRAIIDLIVRLPSHQCPHCRQWIGTERQHNKSAKVVLALLWQISEALGFCLEAPFRLNRSGEDGADRELERGAADVAFAVFD